MNEPESTPVLNIETTSTTTPQSGATSVANDRQGVYSVMALRHRVEEVLGDGEQIEIFMRTPNPFLKGETPWEVMYLAPGGRARIENILDLVEDGRLAELASMTRSLLPERRAS